MEFAVSTAAAGAKHRPPLPIPGELRRFLRSPKLPAAALGKVRAAVDADVDFRKRVAQEATDELVDPIGLLWLNRPDGWVETIDELRPASAGDERAAIHREERRRRAAQEVAARARTELRELSAELARERAAKAELIVETQRLRTELDEVRNRLREAQRVEHATAQALAKAEAALVRAQSSAAAAEASVAEAEQTAIDAGKVRSLIESALAAASGEIVARLAQALDELPDARGAALPVVDAAVRRPSRRKPLSLPGGALKGSAETAEAWLRSAGVKVFVDGYNVAKLGWPALGLDEQRQQCIRAAENLAKRWKLELTIVFDGASIEGAHAPIRRRVHIVYSPEGVSADDVLRSMVTGSDPDLPVVVVTNDRAIIADVTKAGGNTVSSDVFLSLTR